MDFIRKQKKRKEKRKDEKTRKENGGDGMHRKQASTEG